MFSATFPVDIQKLAGQFLHDYIFVTVGIIGGACTDVEQVFFEVDKFKKRNKLLEILREGNEYSEYFVTCTNMNLCVAGTDKTLVFVETKRNADFIASYLSENNINSTSIHGDRLQRERETALRDFKAGRRNILVATGVAARGLDIDNVKHVINFDLPKSIDEYVHRIGRTGRVGKFFLKYTKDIIEFIWCLFHLRAKAFSGLINLNRLIYIQEYFRTLLLMVGLICHDSCGGKNTFGG